jgi:flagellar biosynthetic protein FlhB
VAEIDKESKTHEPTPRRREQAREKGQVPRSKEINTVAILLGGLLAGVWALPAVLGRYGHDLGAWLAVVGRLEIDAQTVPVVLARLATEVGLLSAPFVGAALVAGVGAHLSQGGFSVNAERLAPNFARVDPFAGLARILSADGLVTLVKAVLKLVVVGTIAYRVAVAAEEGAEALVSFSIPDILAFIGSGVRSTVGWVLLALVVLAALDYAWERHRSEQKLRMTPQEVKDELRASEGDVKIKRRFRKFHQELSKNRMLAEVPHADVVITNPVHVAVALRYVAELMGAPRVVAKGADEVAAQIKDIARRAGVPIVERRALARALFRSVKIGQEVPSALYRAVAEVLAYVYSLARRGLAANRVSA